MQNYHIILLIITFFHLHIICMNNNYEATERWKNHTRIGKNELQGKSNLSVETKFRNHSSKDHVGRNAMFENEILMYHTLENRVKNDTKK
jgi:hypothetical protein